jgi:hypothetical protein
MSKIASTDAMPHVDPLQAANIIRLGQVEKLDKAVPRRKVQENHQILCNTVLPIAES